MISGRPGLMSQLNRSLVLRTLKEQGPMSQAELSRVTGISPGAICRIVHSLTLEQRINAIGMGDSQGGRRPMMLEFNAAAGFVVGLSIDAGSQRAVLVDLGGSIVASETREYEPGFGVTEVEELIRDLMSNSAVDPSRIGGVGIGVPGSVVVSTGEVHQAKSLGWRNVPLGSILRESLGMQVLVDNDVNMAVCGELWMGAAKDKRDVVMIMMSTGVGAGIALDGQIYRGRNNAAGEIGYMVVHPDAFNGDYTGWGHLETLIRKPSMVGDTLAYKNPSCDGDSIPDYLAMAAVNVIACLDPEMVIVGGWAVDESPGLVEAVSQKVSCLVSTQCKICAPELGRLSCAIGAAACVLHAEKQMVEI